MAPSKIKEQRGWSISRQVDALQVRRWRRWGHDRLYVIDGTRNQVGWVNLRTGETTIERPELENAFLQAVADYEVKTRRRGSDAGPDGIVEPGWVDLAANRPGEAIRARAEEELASMKEEGPVRTVSARALDIRTEESAWRVGADGEETVGWRLDKLKASGWQVLHSVAVGTRGCDIDHVLIGPGGVFTVNTKNHHSASVWVAERALMVNGHKKSYLVKSHFEAKRAHRLLSTAVGCEVLVRPVLVILCRSFHVKRQPEDVTVLSPMDVPRYFKRTPRVLSSEEIEAVFERARRSITWAPSVQS